jgi:replicative DNA helicase
MVTNNVNVDDVAQESLISTLLYLPGQIKDLIGILTPDDFSNQRMGSIYNAIINIYDNDESISLASVVAYLELHGDLQKAGGINEVQRLFNDGALNGTMQSVGQWAKLIKEKSTKSKILPVLADANKEVQTPGSLSRNIIPEVQKQLTDITMGMTNSKNLMDVSQYYDDYYETLKQRMEKYRKFGKNPLIANNGVPSGFPTIDKYVGGWQPGQVITIGGRTGTGKSFTASNCMIAAARAGRSVLFFSLEMGHDEIMDRVIAAMSQVKLTALRNGSLGEDDLAKVYAQREEFKKFKVEIDTTPNIDINHIKAEATKRKTSVDGLDLVIVDYLQLVTPDFSKSNKNREQQVADISRSMKLLSMQLNVPIIDLVQLNREKKDDEDPTPTINDIRESNAIAQDSSVIILLHRDIKSADAKQPTLFIIGKNRNGRSGIRFECYNLLTYGMFKEKDSEGSAFSEDSEQKPSAHTDNSATSSDSADESSEYVPNTEESIDAWLDDDTSSDTGLGDSGFDDFGSFDSI